VQFDRLGNEEKQLEYYTKAIKTDPNRREAYIKTAFFYRNKGQYIPAIAYAKASLEIPWTDYYANDKAMYEHVPHELLYISYGWTGQVEKAREHIMKALSYQRDNPMYLRDTKFYFDYPANNIQGWFSYEEQKFMYDMGKIMNSVIELGSWKGRSTHALCSSGCPKVLAIDTWEGSKAEPEAHSEAKNDKVYNEFLENTKGFTNLTHIRADINDAVERIADTADCVFIDAGHTYEEVKNDIQKWKGKARIMLCGHDYVSVWPGVRQAVDEELGGPDEIHDSIWVKWMHKPKVSICIPTLGRPEKLHRLIEAIKQNAGYDNYEIIVKADNPIPNNEGAPKTLKKCVDESTGELVMFLGNDCIPQKDFLKLAVIEMVRVFPQMDGLIGLNDLIWPNGEMFTHWLASKKLLPYLDGEFFHTGYFHAGCDNELTQRCRKINKAVWCEKAKIIHENPGKAEYKNQMDELYANAYRQDKVQHDRELLHKRAKELGFDLDTNFSEPK
jgi:hypothetical protein